MSGEEAAVKHVNYDCQYYHSNAKKECVQHHLLEYLTLCIEKDIINQQCKPIPLTQHPSLRRSFPVHAMMVCRGSKGINNSVPLSLGTRWK